jgi:hypothetical protein
MQFGSNEDFWDYVVSNRSIIKLQNVSLLNFRICNWFPRVPGIFHTTTAMKFRADARAYTFSKSNDVFYDPHGKSRMIKGGIGSIKFQPVQLEGELFWLCTATSDSYCHTGIPLFIPNYLYESIELGEFSEYAIKGRTKFIPKSFDSNFNHYVGLPKLYIHVESLNKTNTRNSYEPILVTPTVYFKSPQRDYGIDLVTYAQCESGENYNTERLFDWFLNYTEMYEGQIMTNFDEQCPLFENATFSLQRVMQEEIRVGDVQNLNIYSNSTSIRAERMESNTSTVTIGNGNNISGNVVAAQTVTNSFKTIDKAVENPQIKESIVMLEESVKALVESMENKNDANAIARDVKSFCEEVNSEMPRENTLKHYLGSISEVAAKAGAIGIKVVNVISTLSPLVKVLTEHISG